MGRIKLAICLDDREYQARFVKCLMNHYKERYELHIFEDAGELRDPGNQLYGGFFLGETAYEIVELQEEEKSRALVLNEENQYQEVYKLVEALEILLGDDVAEASGDGETGKRVVGIYSLTMPHMQMPFAATLSGIYAEKDKTILVDFQADSGLAMVEKDGAPELGMEDVMAISMTGTYSKSRLLSAIGRHRQWDYVYPVVNSRCLQELSGEMVSNIVGLLSGELEYQTIVVNVGEGVAGIQELAEMFDAFYLLYPKGDAGTWREKCYVEEMERRGKDEFLHRIHRIEVPAVLGTDEDWDNLSEQWKWNAVGNVLRKLIWEETAVG